MGIYNKKDFYYKKAKLEGYLSRAAYKLIEINRKYSLIKKGDIVADLGCAPGGFLQVASELVGSDGIVVGVDLEVIGLEKENIFFVHGDFTKEEIKDKMLSLLNGRRFDVILSDMAPKTTGITFRDAYLSFGLANEAFVSARRLLKKGGNILIKIFEGDETKILINDMKKCFGAIYLNRPDSTRKGSKEIYIIAKQYKLLME
ncbi:MAG: RlmE family RNA methyltransferase [Deltaproteobacteria bacterium]|nr:RlmE family RNA methyltransferase [Deltaproteobacteria bacterium]